jgi:hypothetical protein
MFTLQFGFIMPINSAEVDKGLVIIDNSPWKVSWVCKNEHTEWVLKAIFDNGVLSTYFKNPPPKNGFGLDPENKPLKQEFVFHTGEKFVSIVCEFEQWPDGAKAYSFKFEQKFSRHGKNLVFGTTAIIEEVGNAKNEIRYALYRDFK